MTKIAIIDYGMGNLYSVRNTFACLGMRAHVLQTAARLDSYEKMILPGVGAFGDAMRELKKRGLIAPLLAFVSSGRPLLGICLGMQLLFEASEESKGIAGLGLVAGTVKRFSSRLKCPHMGWNEIEKISPQDRIFKGLGNRIHAYFCHSYYVKPANKSAVVAETQYGIRFASVIRQKAVYGMQFHPEKSQETGLALLRNFILLR